MPSRFCYLSYRPAPGYRSSTSGALDNVANHGFNWASSTKNNNSSHLDFYMTHLNPTSANHRSYSFQLRCLSE